MRGVFADTTRYKKAGEGSSCDKVKRMIVVKKRKQMKLLNKKFECNRKSKVVWKKVKNVRNQRKNDCASMRRA